MEAKPIIEVIAAVESLDEARALVPVLERIGYEPRGDRFTERAIEFTRTGG